MSGGRLDASQPERRRLPNVNGSTWAKKVNGTFGGFILQLLYTHIFKKSVQVRLCVCVCVFTSKICRHTCTHIPNWSTDTEVDHKLGPAVRPVRETEGEREDAS